MNIAVVGGPFLHQGELNLLAPLAARHSITLYIARGVPIERTNHDFRVVALPWIGTLTGSPSRLGAGVVRGLHRLTGHGYALRGLVARLRDAEVIHTHEAIFTHSCQAIQAKQRYGPKVVVAVLENIPFPFEQFRWCARPIERLRLRVLSGADAFIAVTREACDILMLQGVSASRIHLIPYGVDLTQFRAGPKDVELIRAFGLREDHLVLLFVGRWVWEKGVYDFLYALKKLRDEGALAFQALLLGSGPEGWRMRRVVAALGLTDVVRWGGHQPYAKLPAIYRLADLVVLPSLPTRNWQEQFGMTMVEAMAMGKALITTWSGVIPEVVGDAALLVQPGDYRALAGAIRRLLENSEMRQHLGEAGRRWVEVHYDASKLAQQLEGVYQSLVRS